MLDVATGPIGFDCMVEFAAFEVGLGGNFDEIRFFSGETGFKLASHRFSFPH